MLVSAQDREVSPGGLMTDLPARGEVWWCEMPAVGRRPVVILSRDAMIPRHRRALIAPCTTTIRDPQSEVLLEPGDDPVPLRSAVNLDSIESVSIAILVERLGRVADARCARSPPPLQSPSPVQAELRSLAVGRYGFDTEDILAVAPLGTTVSSHLSVQQTRVNVGPNVSRRAAQTRGAM